MKTSFSRPLRMLALVTSLSFIVCSTACAPQTQQQAKNPYELGSDYVEAGYAIANDLDANLRLPLSKDQPIIVASFVNVNNLSESSSFGRMIAEHVGSRLSQRGYKIVELKLRQSSIFMQEGKGEFMLRRDVKEISRMHNAAAVVVGTYASVRSSAARHSTVHEKIYISSRIVRSDDSTIISSCDYSVQNTPIVSPVQEW